MKYNRMFFLALVLDVLFYGCVGYFLGILFGSFTAARVFAVLGAIIGTGLDMKLSEEYRAYFGDNDA